MGFYRTLKVGQHYLNIWPLEPKLGAIFPENRVIKATLFAQKMMPFLAVLFVVWQQIYARGDNMAHYLRYVCRYRDSIGWANAHKRHCPPKVRSVFTTFWKN